MFLLQTKALIVDQVLRIGDVQIYLPREMVHPARLEKVIKSPGRTTTGSPTWLTVSIEPSGIRGKEDRDHGTMAPPQSDHPPPAASDFSPQGQENRLFDREVVLFPGERYCDSAVHHGNADTARPLFDYRPPLPRYTLEGL